MQMIVLTGFLGSGKTTALLCFARELAASGSRVAIIVNEIGDVGIDNLLLKQLGTDVWELLGGCICCTLTGQLAETLSRISTDYAPDYVFLEPSGASNPTAIPSALQYNKAFRYLRITWIAIVDPLRLEELVEVLEPLMESHILVADAALITKQDLATPGQMEAARKWIATLRPGICCIAVDMKSGTLVSLRGLLPC